MRTGYPPTAPLDSPIKLAVLISGGGTTLNNLVSRIRESQLDAKIALVLAGQEDCGGIQKAKQAGLGCEIVPRRQFRSVDDFSLAIFDACRKANVDLVTLAGFLSLIHIPDDFRYRVMNIHPSLIPAFCGQGFYGHKVHEAALDRGVKVSGCTVHFADNQYDHGPIIVQKSVPVLESDTPEGLAKRVFAAECEAYPDAIRLFASGKLIIEHGRLVISA